MISKLYMKEYWDVTDPELVHFLYSSAEINRLHPSKDQLLLENIARNGDGTRRKMAFHVLDIDKEPEVSDYYITDGVYDEEYWLLHEQVMRVDDTELLKEVVIAAPLIKARLAFCRLTGYFYPSDEDNCYSHRTYEMDVPALLSDEEVISFCKAIARENKLLCDEAYEMLKKNGIKELQCDCEEELTTEKVIIEIIKGETKGKRYEYKNADRIFVGRNEDCTIVLPENTVSRYHCLLDINPPIIKIQDFGSLNGTFLNEEKIGQRERDKSRQEAGDEVHAEYELHDGDVIRLGKRCELKVFVEKYDIMAISGEWDGQVSDEKEADAKEADAKEADAKEADPVQDKPQDKMEHTKDEYQAANSGQEKPKEKTVLKEEPEPKKEPESKKEPEHDLEMENAITDLLIALLGGAKKEQPAGPSPVAGYDKVSLLGKGGMGEVWKVREKKTGKIFALKTMLPQVEKDEKAQKMFLREAKLTEFLNHDNVVRTYKTGVSNNVYYIMMDMCEGGSVDDLMVRYDGKLPLNLATFIILQVLEGLNYVHNAPVQAEIVKRGLFGGEKEILMNARGLVHRDFKPGNIFLADKSNHPVAKVADFGMAKAFQAAGLTGLSAEGMVKGTVPFMPRQQALDCRYAKPEVDVWAAAATYYNMLTGKFPKNFRQGVNMWQALVIERAVPVRQRDPSIPESLARVIDRALIEIPKIGYDSAAVLRDDIIRALPEGTRNYCMDIIK